MSQFYSVSVEETLKTLKSRTEGLSSEEAGKRLQKYGKNSIESGKRVSLVGLFFKQFQNLFTLILTLAIGVSVTITIIGTEDRIPEAIFIFAIIMINSILGFIQNYKAARGMEALKGMVVPKTTIIRDGEKREISADEIVIGDIVVLEEGEQVPADARLIEAHALKADESAFTGESVPVLLNSDTLDKDTSLQDRKNMAFMGTYITQGEGLAVVTETGMETELGDIAKDLSGIKRRKTPFELEIDKLAKQITFVIAVAVLLVALMTIVRGHIAWIDVLILSMGLFVGAIPEAMPAIVTFAMSLGTKRMADEKALVRDLPVVASLGSVDIICSDKTGTLTENQMTVQKIYFDDHEIDIKGQGYHEEGELKHVENRPIPMDDLDMLLRCGLLCNNASVQEKTGEKAKFIGDPTEIALLVSARKSGLHLSREKAAWPRIEEIPFTSEREEMTTINKHNGDTYAFTKGAPEVILKNCEKILINGKEKRLDDETKERILSTNSNFADDALRVLGFSYKAVKSSDQPDIEEKQVFLGLQAMIDPPRSEVKGAIETAHKAGIKTVMITGDNAVTAAAIGRKLGFGQNAVNGRDLSGLSVKELQIEIEKIDIVSRALPKDKLTVARSFESNDHVVAMTGNGVNDAPALKAADVGVAMGERGTDVAKDAAGMILLDDNYDTIVKAVKEGRTIYANIRKFVNYLLTCNLAEVFVIFIASILGFIPLTVIQILWINIITDTTVAMAQATDPSNPNVMEKPPRPKKKGIIDRRLKWMVASIGVEKVIVLLFVFLIGEKMGGYKTANTMLFTTIVLYSFVRVSVIRIEEGIPIFVNKWVNLAIVSSLILQMLVLYTPASSFFDVIPLGIHEWGVMLAFTVVAWVLGVGITKTIKRFVTA